MNFKELWTMRVMVIFILIISLFNLYTNKKQSIVNLSQEQKINKLVEEDNKIYSSMNELIKSQIETTNVIGRIQDILINYFDK